MKTNKGILIKGLNKTHENKWVALSVDYKKVIACSKDLASLRKKVSSREVILTRIPSSETGFAF